MKNTTLLLLVVLFSCVNNKQITVKQNEGYRILKIDSMDNIYIVYVQKDDSLYKVLSLKEHINQRTNHSKIKVGKQYPLKLKSLFEKNFLGKYDLSPQALPYVEGVDYYGTKIKIEPDSINDLYTTENLKGLLFINAK